MSSFGTISGIGFLRRGDIKPLLTEDTNGILLTLKTPIPHGGISGDDICEMIKEFYHEETDAEKTTWEKFKI